MSVFSVTGAWRICSGARDSGGDGLPVALSAGPSRRAASSRSSNLTRPSSSSITFLERSAPCTRPMLWNVSTAPPRSRAMSSVLATCRDVPFARTSLRRRPCTNSVTMNAQPFAARPQSRTRTRAGWAIEAGTIERAIRSSPSAAAVDNAITRSGIARRSSLTQHLANRVHDGIDLGRLLRRDGSRRRLEILAHAIVLFPALPRNVEIDGLPLLVTVLLEPIEVAGHELRERADGLAIVAAIVERDEDGLDRDGVDGLGLPRVRLRGNRGARIELGDVLVRDGDETEVIAGGDALVEQPDGIAGDEEHGVDPAGLQLAEGLIGIDGDHLAGRDPRDLEQEPGGEVRAATLAADRHPLVRQVVEGGDPAAGEQVDLLVVQREDHLDLLGDPLQGRVGLHLGDEGEDVRLDDADLHAGPLVDRIDVFHRALGVVHGDADAVRLAERLEIEAELIVRALVAARDDADVRGPRANGADDG